MLQKDSSDITSAAGTNNGFSVAPSPLNAVKFDLAIILLGGLLLLLTQHHLTDNALWQLLLLLVYGICGMLWVVLRTRRLLSRLTQTIK